MVRIGMFLGDRYEILEKIGSGGMAEVFKGKDHKLNRFVAVKVLKDEFVEDKNFVRKFKEEAQAAAGLAHPNIVNVYDVGDEQNVNYIVMELVEGITLKTYIEKKGRLTVKEATSIAIQVASGLEIAHNNQIVHRDIKPQNIIISREGKVKVTDFGIAKSVSSNTNTADAMGSVHYTSPEQARGGYSDAKSDIYSLGIVMYEMVTGRVPFDGETTVVVAVKHLQEDITSPRVYASDIPVSLEHIILKCTEKSPDRRYANVTELIADLKQSLLTPDVNFVKEIVPDGAKTVAITRDEISKIKKETGRIPVAEDDAESRYAYLDEMNGGDEDDYEDEDYEDEDYDDEDGDYDPDEDYDEENDGGEDGGMLDPKLEKIMTIGGIVAAVIIVIIIIVILAKVLGFGKSSSSDNKEDETQIEDVLDETVEVPSVLGMSYSEAKEALNELGLGIQLGETRSSSEYEAGQIIGQSEEAGTEVDKNTTIVVDICGDGEQVEVPDVKSYTQSRAESALKEQGFSVDISEAFSDDVDAGKVISTSPAAGRKAARGTVVTVVVSKGKQADEQIEVPTITGGSESSAKQKLSAAGLTSGTVTQAFIDTVEEGNIISQNPSAGTKVDKGTKVSYVVSKGKEVTDVYIGNYSGMTEAEAVSKAQGRGLNTTVDYEFSSSVANGYVTRTEPGNGSTVKSGSTLKIWVSKGTEQVSVPSVTGKSSSEASSLLAAQGLTMATGGTTATSDQSLDGKVASQSPSAGTTVSKGSTVTVSLYVYTAPTPDPGTGGEGTGGEGTGGDGQTPTNNQ